MLPSVLRLTFLVLLGVASFLHESAPDARGVVYDDANANGLRDPGEPGIAGVRVSNGVDVVATGPDGSWQLAASDETVFFLTKPRGWMTPLGADGLPRFHYVHQPAGSPPGLRYPGIAPTGPLPASIDFALRRRDEPDAFEALLFSDTQPQTDAELDFIRDDVVAGLIGTTAAFGMTLGDILFDDLSLFPRYNALIGSIGIPWYNVPGNHELNFEAADDRHSLETFKRIFGPPYYAFEHGDVLFVVLDNIEYQGNGKSDPADVRGDGGYIANIGKRQLEWLKNELAFVAPDKPVFVAMHAPLFTHVSEGRGVNTQDRRGLFELLAGRENLYSVAGHTHTTEHHYLGADEGFPGPGTFHHHVLATVSGSWWSGPLDERGIPVALQRDGTPNGWHVLAVDGRDLSVRYQAAGAPATEQMRIVFDVAHHGLDRDALRDFRPGELFDGRMPLDAVPAAEVLVNLYDGGPRSVVSFAIDGGAALPMRRVRRVDPHANELFLRNADTVKSWVEAVPSTHLFAADLPDDLGAGVHALTVEARDEFGRVHRASAVLEIVGR
jgi:hypothetical protein